MDIWFQWKRRGQNRVETYCEWFVLGSSGNKGVNLGLIYDILLSFVHNNRLPRDPIFPFYEFTPKIDHFIINLI